MKLLRDYRPEIRDLCERILRAGGSLESADNGEYSESWEGAKASPQWDAVPAKAFIDALEACDEATLYVRDPQGVPGWLFLVLGNEPGVLVNNYSPGASAWLDRVTEGHAAAWEGTAQPMRRAD